MQDSEFGRIRSPWFANFKTVSGQGTSVRLVMCHASQIDTTPHSSAFKLPVRIEYEEEQ
jgi:hypothetical protein